MTLFIRYQGSMRQLDAPLVWQIYCQLELKHGLTFDVLGTGVLLAWTARDPTFSNTPVFKVLASILILRVLLREVGGLPCSTPAPVSVPIPVSAAACPMENPQKLATAPLAPTTPPPPAATMQQQPQSQPQAQAQSPVAAVTAVAAAPAPAIGYNPRAFWQGCVGTAARRLPSLKCGRGYAHYIPDSQQG